MFLAYFRYHRCCRLLYLSKPHANRPEVGSLLCHFQTSISTYHFLSFSSGKAPRKQLATKAARKTAQVCLFVAIVVVTVNNIALNFFSLSSYTHRLPLGESRSPTDSVPVPSLSVKSGVTKSPLSSWSESFPSRGLFVKSLRTSR